MAFEHKDNTGSLFKNDDRVTDNQPNAKGKAKIDGKDFFIAAWTRESVSGVRYQSLAFTPVKEEATAEAKDRAKAAVYDDDSVLNYTCTLSNRGTIQNWRPVERKFIVVMGSS